MYIDKIIKKEVAVLVTSILVVVILLIGVSFSFFLSVDSGKSNIISIGDLNIKFCEGISCEKDYSNFGQVIGTKNVGGESVIDKIYPYQSDFEALETTPYIFNIENTGSLDSLLTIKLTEDKDYIPNSSYSNYESITNSYSDNIKIGISNCSKEIDRENVLIKTYSELENNVILENDEINSGDNTTYCLWTWLDSNTPNNVQNTYFVANLDFKAEYKPKTINQEVVN